MDGAYESQKIMAKGLGIKVDALSEVLSSATVNRWEVYNIIKGGN